MIGHRLSSLLFVFLMVGAPAAVAPACAQGLPANDVHLDSNAQAPTDAEIRQRREELIANQHADDEVLNFYERVEHYVDRSSGSNPRVLNDRIYRIVPTGGGTMKILLRNHGAEVSAEEYQRQLQAWRDVLQMMTSAGDSKGATARAKYEKRERQRSDFVNATKDAFVPKWIGRESYAGRTCDVFKLDPNPDFHPSSMFQSALAHVTAKIWVDRSSNQLVRGEAWVTGDISFVAGIAGKVYRGSRVEIDQSEVAPGVWLPTHYDYDFAGRKFLFPFTEHETIDVSRYKHIGPPEDALAEVTSELASGDSPLNDP